MVPQLVRTPPRRLPVWHMLRPK